MRPKNIPQDKERLYEDALHLKMINNSLREENVRLKTRIAQMETETDDRGSSTLASSLKQTIKDLRLYCKKRDEEIALLKRNMKNSRVTELEVELEAYQEECARLGKIISENKMHQQAQLKHDDLEDRLRIELSANSNLKQEVKQLSAVLQDLREQHEQDKQLIHQLEQKLKPKKSQEQIQMLNLEVQKLKTQLEEVSVSRNQLDMRFNEKKEDLEKLQNEYKTKETEIKEIKTELESKENEIKTMELQLKTARKSVNSTTRTIRDLEQNKSQLEAQISVLTAEITKKQAEIDTIQKEKIDMKQANFDELESKQEAWDIEKAGLETEIADKEQNLSALQTEIDELKSLQKEQENSVSELNRNIDKLKNDLERVEKEKEETELIAKNREMKIEKVEKELENEKNQKMEIKNSLEFEVKQKNSQIENLKLEILRLGEEIEIEKNKMRELIEELNNEKRRFAEFRTKLMNKIAKKTGKFKKHCEDLDYVLENLNSEKTGFCSVKTVKKTLKKHHLKKFPLSIIRILTENESKEINLEKLREVLIIERDDESKGSESHRETGEKVEEMQEIPSQKEVELPKETENVALERENPGLFEGIEGKSQEKEDEKEEEKEDEKSVEEEVESPKSEEKEPIPEPVIVNEQIAVQKEASDKESSEEYSFEEVISEEKQEIQPLQDSASVVTSLNTLIRHLTYRLQIHRFTAAKLLTQLSGGETQVSCSALQLHFSQPPLSVSLWQDQQLLLLVCLEQPLTEANLERKWEGSIPTESLMTTLIARIGVWEVFTKEDEESMDVSISETLTSHLERFKALCEETDTRHERSVTYADFTRILQELGIVFDEKCLQYLKLLFYSQDSRLDIVPYETFIGAFVPAETTVGNTTPGMTEEQRVSLIRQQVTEIAGKLGSLDPRNVFASSAQGLITPAQFRSGLYQLGITMSEETLQIMLEGLQYEGASEPCISLVELEEIITRHKPDPVISDSDQSELMYEGEEDDRM